MQLSHEITIQELRRFFWVLSSGVLILFYLLPWWRNHELSAAPALLIAMLGALACFRPRSLQPIYRIWMRIGSALGWINSRIILGLLFFAVLTPLGMLLRAFKKETLELGWMTERERNSVSFRRSSKRRTPASMEKPF